MSRDYKDSGFGALFHIYNRGNNKEKIFLDEQDYKSFLFRLGLALGFEEEDLKSHPVLSLPHSRVRITRVSKSDFTLHSFCLMPTHFHLILEQNKDISPSTFILKVCTSYSKYLNKKYGRVGHVFQDQFKSVLIESNPQLMWVSAYVHMNPVKDGFSKHPRDYIWSSYKEFENKRDLPIVNTEFLKSVFGQKNFEKETLTLMSKGTFDRLG